jgi:hypothetical protein
VRAVIIPITVPIISRSDSIRDSTRKLKEILAEAFDLLPQQLVLH